jgi:hypothetical protein
MNNINPELHGATLEESQGIAARYRSRSIDTEMRLNDLLTAIVEFRKVSLYPADCLCHKFPNEAKMAWQKADKLLDSEIKATMNSGFTNVAEEVSLLVNVSVAVEQYLEVARRQALFNMTSDQRTKAHRERNCELFKERMVALKLMESTHQSFCAFKAINSGFTNTETKREAPLPPKGQSAELPKGLGRDGHKPLMRNRTANEAPSPIGNAGGNTLSSEELTEVKAWISSAQHGGNIPNDYAMMILTKCIDKATVAMFRGETTGNFFLEANSGTMDNVHAEGYTLASTILLLAIELFSK